LREVVALNTAAGSVGAVAARYDYSAYQGPQAVGPQTLSPTHLTIGRYYHHAGSGLELALYRAYDPELGRWLSKDPIGERGGLNLYGYVKNDPLRRVDLKGQNPLLLAIGAALIGAGVFIYKANKAMTSCSRAGDERRANQSGSGGGVNNAMGVGPSFNGAIVDLYSASSSPPSGTSLSGPVTFGPQTEAGEACETGYDVINFLYGLFGLGDVKK
jgi:RHS repeat-associated protein